MMQRMAALGYQQLTSLSSAVNLTLPVGAQQAEGTSCSLSGTLLTVAGTVIGKFAVGQIVQGTGIPPNTYIIAPGSQVPNPTTWQLSQACTTESGETVTAYAQTGVNLAIIRATGETVYWRDDGTAPTATVGMPMLTSDPPFPYAGPLEAIQFIESTAGATVDVSYYSLSG